MAPDDDDDDEDNDDNDDKDDVDIDDVKDEDAGFLDIEDRPIVGPTKLKALFGTAILGGADMYSRKICWQERVRER